MQSATRFLSVGLDSNLLRKMLACRPMDFYCLKCCILAWIAFCFPIIAWAFVFQGQRTGILEMIGWAKFISMAKTLLNPWYTYIKTVEDSYMHFLLCQAHSDDSLLYVVDRFSMLPLKMAHRVGTSREGCTFNDGGVCGKREVYMEHSLQCLASLTFYTMLFNPSRKFFSP